LIRPGVPIRLAIYVSNIAYAMSHIVIAAGLVFRVLIVLRVIKLAP
jgi:hypothetical protein